MRKLFRLFVVFAALCLSLVATLSHALVPQVQTWRSYFNGGGATLYGFTSWSDACLGQTGEVDAAAKRQGYKSGVAIIVTVNSNCQGQYTRGDNSTFNNAAVTIIADVVACPANSTAVSGGCQCSAGYDESGGKCVPHTNQCTAKTGVVGILSWTEGYTRTPDEGDRQAVGPIVSPPSSGEVCDGGCAVSLQTSGPGVQPYVSQSPTANGLYRRSVDYPSLGLGRECTMGTADAGAKKDAPMPDCPGSVGDLGNGKPVCVGTAAKPITPTPLGTAPGATPIAGNPAAGGKPPSGEGSGTGSAGRTPSTGNGGPAGGPAGAATGGKGGGAGGTAAGVGTGGSGTGDEPHKPCGGPGEPTCNVKVDEKGVPEGVGTSFDTANKTSDDSFKAQSKAIEDAGKRETGPAWDFTFQLPTGCVPIQTAIADFTLDPCRYQGMIHDLMSMVWAAVTVFTIIGMVGRTIRGT